MKDILVADRSVAVLWLLCINFFGLTVFNYGNRRFVEVIDFVYIILALKFYSERD
jgi:hypothetical protein